MRDTGEDFGVCYGAKKMTGECVSLHVFALRCSGPDNNLLIDAIFCLQDARHCPAHYALRWAGKGGVQHLMGIVLTFKI